MQAFTLPMKNGRFKNEKGEKTGDLNQRDTMLFHRGNRFTSIVQNIFIILLDELI